MIEMDERQLRALAKAKQVLLDAEKARSQGRTEQILQKLSSGDIEVLKDRNFAENLGPYIHQMYLEGRRSEVISLLARFAEHIVENDLQIRQNSVSVLTKFSASMSDSNDLEILCALFLQFVHWIVFETEYIRVFGVACSQMHRLTLRLLSDEKYWQETLKMTSVLHDIECGRLKKKQ